MSIEEKRYNTLDAKTFIIWYVANLFYIWKTDLDWLLYFLQGMQG
jgi:hypothetical protein